MIRIRHAELDRIRFPDGLLGLNFRSGAQKQ